MIADIAPHPCGGGAKVFPRNCRLRVFFFIVKSLAYGGRGKIFFTGKSRTSAPKYPFPHTPNPF